MKELKSYFVGRGQVKGYIFNQIRASKHAYLYEVSENNLIHYEVFKRCKNSMYDCISYPTDKAFGKWAWTYMNLEKAIEKFNKIELEGLIKENYNG
jgi:hypothetical protein